MRITKNVRIQFNFGEDDEDTYDVDLQISWEASNETEVRTALDEAVQKWIRENVSYTWEEVEVEEDDP
ncbi:hypothetical protein RW092_09835 [Paenibacillus sp. 3LSP]|uniref:hypothetical protein n=1 Tax=Paenibacillus sp. 3LSP TaxID=2800795 RepID=UPI0028FDB1A3|nr:hypothetical protein [Paenibacillus sp. 3LSP]MDU0330503.1 hypothetical protein [Paenibacillus sp. 3LSP]